MRTVRIGVFGAGYSARRPIPAQGPDVVGDHVQADEPAVVPRGTQARSLGPVSPAA
jgi:hypothetical protein